MANVTNTVIGRDLSTSDVWERDDVQEKLGEVHEVIDQLTPGMCLDVAFYLAEQGVDVPEKSEEVPTIHDALKAVVRADPFAFFLAATQASQSPVFGELF